MDRAANHTAPVRPADLTEPASMNKNTAAKTCTRCPLCNTAMTAIGPQWLCLAKQGGCGAAFQR